MLTTTTYISRTKANQTIIYVLECSCGAVFSSTTKEGHERCPYCVEREESLPSISPKDLYYLSIYFYDTVIKNYPNKLTEENI